MSIRLIARELYQLRREVERIEKKIESADCREQERLKDSLRKARAERDRMRNILNGQKDDPKR